MVQVGGSGARQPGPGLAVRPVCFRRVFGVLAVKDLALGDDALQRDWRVETCNRLLTEKLPISACAADFSIELSIR